MVGVTYSTAVVVKYAYDDDLGVHDFNLYMTDNSYFLSNP